MPYEFTENYAGYSDWHWQRLFAPLKGLPDLRAVEIGSYEGSSAVWFLDNVLTHESCRLVCIDPWGPDAESREPVFDRNVASHPRGGQVEKRKGTGRHILPTLADGIFDFVYVDGSHEARDVLTDALLALPLLKPGGILLFDDYEWRDPLGQVNLPPRQGINAFLDICASQIVLEHREYQVVVRKK
ncbi:MAG: class I SAM-dependent methyltransferase [Patescibacteria group bacterium]|nr:class I SAM-dependent methyltransferase [Patescibacteria group bacterium]